MWKSKKEVEKGDTWFAIGILLLAFIISFMLIAILDINIRLDEIENPEMIEIYDDSDEVDIGMEGVLDINEDFLIDVNELEIDCNWDYLLNQYILVCSPIYEFDLKWVITE